MPGLISLTRMCRDESKADDACAPFASAASAERVSNSTPARIRPALRKRIMGTAPRKDLPGSRLERLACAGRYEALRILAPPLRCCNASARGKLRFGDA